MAIRLREASAGSIVYAPTARVTHAVASVRTTLRYFVQRCWAEGWSKAILAGRVGTMSATETERAYLTTLATGSMRRVRQAVSQRSVKPIGQIGAMTLGLVLAGFGYVASTVAGSVDRMLGKQGSVKTQ
jgi:hypothetical protein